jgi:two-component system response regulator RegA
MNRADPPHLLVIDDDAAFTRVLTRALTRRGFAAFAAQNAEEALLLARTHEPEFVVLDLNLAGSSGLRLIAPLLAVNPACRILVLTGYASIATTVDAIKLGATQYLAKPADIDAILKALQGGGVCLDDGAPESTMSVDRLEWEHIQRVLRENDGNISATARALKMHRRTLQRKLFKRPAKEH